MISYIFFCPHCEKTIMGVKEKEEFKKTRECKFCKKQMELVGFMEEVD